jgi:large subunit ribosomal protein L29
MADAKAIKPKELRAMPDEELRTQLSSLRTELWTARIKAKDGSLQQSHLLRSLRRRIARAQTIAGERGRSAAARAGREPA